jgi:hypothetical protein
MPFSRIVTAIAVGAVSFAATAAEPPVRALPSDPTAEVRPLTYASAFATYSRLAESEVSPAKLWREANASVASEGMEGSMDMSTPVGSSISTPSAGVPINNGKQDAQGTMPIHMGHQMPVQVTKRAAPASSAHQHGQSTESKGTGK